MEHYWSCFRLSVSNSLDTRLQKSSQSIKFSPAFSPRLAIRPEHSAIQFIADLNHIRINVQLLHFRQNVLCIVVQCRIHFFKGQTLPCFRKILFPRINPKITVVKIQQHLKSQIFCSFCKVNRRFQIICPCSITFSITIIRILPQTQSNIVDTIIF